MKKMIIYLFVIFGITYSFSPLFCIYHKIGDYNSEGRVVSLDIKDEIVILAKYNGLIEFIDVNNPEQPLLLGSCQVPGVVPGVQGKIIIADTLAYVLTQSDGIQIINISNPVEPQIIGSYDYNNVADIIISGNYAYIAGYDQLFVLDVTDILNPVLLSTCYGSLCDISLQDDLIYGIHNSSPNNLRIIDVSNPINPQLLSNFDLPIYSTAGIAVKELVVYISYSQFLWSINIEDPSEPIILDTLVIGNHSSKIIIDNNMAIVNKSTSGFVVIDITNPSDLSLISFYDTSGNAEQIQIYEEIAYIADGYSGLQIVDISNPSIQILSNRFYTNHEASGFDFKDNYLYVGDSSGLEIVSVSEPYNPQLITSVPINSIGISTSVDILDNIAYCCAGYPVCSVNFVDISNPINSYLMGNLMISGIWGATGCVNNSNAFIGSDYGNVLIFEETTLISEYISISEVHRLSTNDTSVFLVEGENGIEFVDISNIYNPTYMGNYDTNGSAHNVVIQNNFMYVSDGEEGAQIIDIHNLQNPIFISSIKPYYNSNVCAEAIIIDNHLIFFDHEWNELFIYNIENPFTPIFVNSFQWNSTMNEIIIRDNVLFSCDSFYGVSIIDFAGFLSSEENLIIMPNCSLSNHPNPFNPTTTIEFSIRNDYSINLSIYNIKGQKIKTLANNEFIKGNHSIIWNGDDEFNKPVSSGVYLYNLKVNGKTETVKKCLLLK